MIDTMQTANYTYQMQIFNFDLTNFKTNHLATILAFVKRCDLTKKTIYYRIGYHQISDDIINDFSDYQFKIAGRKGRLHGVMLYRNTIKINGESALNISERILKQYYQWLKKRITKIKTGLNNHEMSYFTNTQYLMTEFCNEPEGNNRIWRTDDELEYIVRYFKADYQYFAPVFEINGNKHFGHYKVVTLLNQYKYANHYNLLMINELKQQKVTQNEFTYIKAYLACEPDCASKIELLAILEHNLIT